MDDSTMQYIAIAVFGTAVIVAFCHLSCCGGCQLRTEELEDHDRRMNNNPFPVRLENKPLSQEEKEERRFLILMRVKTEKMKSHTLPHEKDLSSRSLTLSKGSLRTSNSTLNANLVSETLEEDEKSGNVDDPEIGHVVVRSSTVGVDETNKFDTENNGNMVRAKTMNEVGLSRSSACLSSTQEDGLDEMNKSNHENFFVESIRSFRQSLRRSLRSSSSMYSQQECPICLEAYKENDEICWSRNKKCIHAFHLDCMMEWLMVHDNCPLCRNNYLEVNTK